MANEKIKKHEELLLGNAMETILAYDNYINTVTEYQFRSHVLPLLKNPFSKDNLFAYQKVVIELTRPLNVVDTSDQTKVLFQVPALVMSPKATIATGKGLTAENFFASLKRSYELGGKDIDERIAAFMKRITVIPNFQDTVIRPLRAILQRYGEDFDVPGLEKPITKGAPVNTTPVVGSSFSDDYED